MSIIKTLKPGYKFEPLDLQKNFHGNQLVYIAWDYHLMFCSPFAYPVQPEMLFKDFINNVIHEAFSLHPEYSQVNWDTTTWLLNTQDFKPDWNKSLDEQGIKHKSVLRFQTPELKGYMNKAV